jgi:hypothetical protein
MMDDALALPVEESDDISVMFAMYGLAARLNRDTAPYGKRIEAMLSEHGAPFLVFMEEVRRGADPIAARAKLPAWDLRARLCAVNAAVVMLDKRAPASWREEVSRGLFVGERQFLAAAKN